MAYESPITIVERIARSATEEMEDSIVRTISLHYGMTVNKEELKKALLYDRGQYDKGYEDALAEVREKVKMAKAEIYQLSPTPTIEDVIDGNPEKDDVWATLIEVDKIIDKYLGEVEHE